MKIAIGSDHAGFLLKQELINYLTTKNIQVADKGCYSEEQLDRCSQTKNRQSRI